MQIFSETERDFYINAGLMRVAAGGLRWRFAKKAPILSRKVAHSYSGQAALTCVGGGVECVRNLE